MKTAAVQAFKESRERVPLREGYLDWFSYVKHEETSCYYRPKDNEDSSLPDAQLMRMLNR